MSIDFTSLITQIPFVVLIIYVIQRRDEQWRKFFSEERELFRVGLESHAAALYALTQQIRMLTDVMIRHDEQTSTMLNLQRGQSPKS